MLRVLHSVSNMARAGIETMLMNYYREMDRSQIQFDFLANKPVPGEYDEEICRMGGRVFVSPGLNPLCFFKYERFVADLARHNPQIKIVHAHNEAMGYYALKSAKDAGVRVRIAHAHNTQIIRDYKYPLKLICKQLLPGAATDYWSCGRDAGLYYYGESRWNASGFILRNAIDVSKFGFRPEERDRLAAESAAAATPSDAAASQTENSKAPMAVETPNPQESWLHELTLRPVIALGLIAAGNLAAFIWFCIRHRNTGINLWYGLGAILLATAALLACFPAMSGVSFIAVHEEGAPEAVEGFFQALERGDADAADSWLAYGAESGLLTPETDAMHAAALQTLRASWEHKLMGACTVEKASAWQEVQLRVLDFSKMEKDLQTETRAQLLNLSRSMKREEIFDEAGNYRSAVAGQAYDRAMVHLLEQPQAYYNTVSCRVELTLTRDGWKIVPTRNLITALSGKLG